jgi:hypothetical protein
MFVNLWYVLLLLICLLFAALLLIFLGLFGLVFGLGVAALFLHASIKDFTSSTVVTTIGLTPFTF